MLSSLALSLAAGAKGPSKTEDRDVAEFDAVSVESGVHASIAIGGRAVEVTAAADVLQRLVTEVKKGVLHLRFERRSGWMHFGHDGEVTVKVRTPHLRAVSASGGAHADVTATTEGRVQLDASGGGNVNVASAPAHELKVDASGGATIAVGGIDAEQVTASGSGGAVLKLSGRADKAELSFSGGAAIKAQRFEVRDASIVGGSGGEARVHVSQAVRGSVSGGSSLRLDGKPKARISTSGGGEVIYAEGRSAPSAEKQADDEED